MEIHFHINLCRPQWTRNWSPRRKLIVLLFLVVALVLPPTAFVVATDTFSDVPSDHIFHDDINAVYGARITIGTSPTTYSPEYPATRGQIAAFLHRGLGRVAYKIGVNSDLSYVDEEVAVLTINTGGAAGGTGFLKVDASINVENTNPTGCPCRIRFYLAPDFGLNSEWQHLTLNNGGGLSSDALISAASGAATLAFPLATGNYVQNVRLMARIIQSLGEVAPSPIRASGSITAIWIPFGDMGGSTINPPFTN